MIGWIWGEDHPHAYGDKVFGTVDLGTDEGSSPRVWGQAGYLKMYSFDLRIIPTRMGTSTLKNYTCLQLGDHPHAYGDKCAIIKSHFPVIGSSPRVWGQVVGIKLIAIILRIIPTRMGTSGS